jgi:flagellar protein FlaI
MLSSLGAVSVQAQVRTRDLRTVRRVKEIVELIGIEPESGDLLTHRAFEWDVTEDRHVFDGKSVLLERIALKRGLRADEIFDEWKRRTSIIEWMVRHGVRQLHDVMRIVSAYYRNPKLVLGWVDKDVSPALTLAGGASP